MARILLVAQGALGDMLPMLAIGARLRASGHHVRVLIPALMRTAVEARDLEYAPLESNDPQQVQRAIVEAAPRSYWRGAVHHGRRLLQAPFVPSFGHVCRLREDVEAADIVVLSYMEGAIAHLAEAANRPCVIFHPTPTLPSPDYAAPVGPLGWHLAHKPRLVNRMTHAAWNRLVWRATREWTNELRRKHLGLPTLSRTTLGLPRLIAASPTLFPRPADWPSLWQMTGFACEPDASSAPLAPELERFLAVGEPPVFVGFSSSPIARPGFWTDVVLPAIDRLGCRAIVGAGWSTISDIASSRVLVVGQVSYRTLFPRVGAIVHACGVGTLSEGVMSGTPAVGLPVFGEQKFIAALAHRRGLIPRPQLAGSVTAQGLASMIETAMSEPGYRSRTRQAGDAIRAEDGTTRACAFIERHLTAGAGH